MLPVRWGVPASNTGAWGKDLPFWGGLHAEVGGNQAGAEAGAVLGVFTEHTLSLPVLGSSVF